MPAGRSERGKTERYYRTRKSVVDVAVGLFSRNGYVGTGVADIGEAAGLARGALYYYIGSKEELLAEIHDRVMDPLIEESSAILGLDVPFGVRLRLLSESLLWQIVNRHDHVWVFLHEYRQLEGEFRDRFRAKRHQFEDSVYSVLREGSREGALRVTDLRLATLSFLNLHNYTYQWWTSKESLGVEELSEFYCDLFLNGVLTEPAAAAADDLRRGRDMLTALRDERA